MKVVFTVDLSNRHVQDVDLLEAYVRDALANFNTHTFATAKVHSVHLSSEGFDDDKQHRDGPRSKPA